MSNPKRPSPHHDGALSATVESLLTAGAVMLMLASVVCMVVLITTAFAAPQVGDVVVFRTGTQVADDLSFIVRRVGSGGRAAAACRLDPEVMLGSGGSLVVESQSPAERTYQVHWAGGRTTAGAQDCGPEADLTIPKDELERMVNAMGGRGIAGRGYVF